MCTIIRFGNLKEISHLGDLGVDGNFREIGWEGVDWMHLAQDRNQ
jgi:hypothetical protein